MDVVGCISWLPSLALLVLGVCGTSRAQLAVFTFSTMIDLGVKIVLGTHTVPPKPQRLQSPYRYYTSTRTQRRHTYLYLEKYRWQQLSQRNISEKLDFPHFLDIVKSNPSGEEGCSFFQGPPLFGCPPTDPRSVPFDPKHLMVGSSVDGNCLSDPRETANILDCVQSISILGP